MKHPPMLLIALAIFIHPAAAQHIHDFEIRHFNTENGLPQNSIKAIAPDEYGFIWIASEAGLLRYDGRSFSIYNNKNTGVATSRILTIARTADRKKLLAIPQSGKMLFIDKGKARLYPYSLNAIFFQLPEYRSQTNDSILDLAFKKYKYMGSQLLSPGNNHMAILHLKEGIRWYKKGVFVAQMSLPPLKDFSSVFILDKAVYLCYDRISAGWLTRLEPGKTRQVRITGDFMKQSPNNRPGETFFTSNDATGAVFLSSGSNLYSASLLPDGNLHTTLLLSGFGLLAHQINTIHYDPSGGRLFLGSGTEGLFVLTRKRFFTSLYPGKEPFTNVYYSLVPISDSSLLSGSGMVFSTQKGSEPGFRELLRKPGNYGYELFRSANRGIWFCYGSTLYQLDYTAHKVMHKFELGIVNALSEHRNNEIWFASYSSGIYKINAAGQLSHILATVKQTQCIVWETDTICWIGTESNLFRFHTTSGKIDTFQALNGKIVRSIHIPKPGEVWICSYENGLYLWKAGKLTSFATNEHPALQTVHKILEDHKGFFWMSTNDGLYQVSRADLLHHSRDSTFQPYFFRYSSEDGFLTNEFNGSRQHSGTQLANGFFAFPSMKGVVFFKPDVTMPELPDKPIIIDKVVVDGREKNPGQHPITIERGFEQMTITPATAYLGNSANLKFEFNLNNSGKWQALTGGSIVFSALSSGDNHVTVRKRSGFGKSGYVYCHLDIYVPPAWWDHTWFYMALLVLLGLLFWLAVWLRTRYWKHRSQRFEEGVQNRTLELNEIILELERSELKLGEQLHFQRLLNENITHDVNAPLKYLNIYTKEVMEQVKAKQMPDIHEMEHIHNATSSIHALVENLTLFLKSKYTESALSNISVWKLVQQKLELFYIGAKRRSILLENRTDPNLLINQNETLLGILLHNLIDNALKYTVKGNVLVTSDHRKEGILLLCIRDTGRGMSEEQVLKYNAFFEASAFYQSSTPSGFGFIIIKEIAKILNVAIHVASTLNEGTEIIITLSESRPDIAQHVP